MRMLYRHKHKEAAKKKKAMEKKVIMIEETVTSSQLKTVTKSPEATEDSSSYQSIRP